MVDSHLNRDALAAKQEVDVCFTWTTFPTNDRAVERLNQPAAARATSLSRS